MTKQIDLSVLFWVVGIMLGVLTPLVGIIYNSLNAKITELKQEVRDLGADVKAVEKENGKIRTNYIDRFNTVNNNISSTKESILEKINAFMLEWQGKTKK